MANYIKTRFALSTDGANHQVDAAPERDEDLTPAGREIDGIHRSCLSVESWLSQRC